MFPLSEALSGSCCRHSLWTAPCFSSHCFYVSPGQALTAELGQTPLRSTTKGHRPLHLGELLQPASTPTPNHFHLLLLPWQGQRGNKRGAERRGESRAGRRLPSPPRAAGTAAKVRPGLRHLPSPHGTATREAGQRLCNGSGAHRLGEGGGCLATEPAAAASALRPGNGAARRSAAPPPAGCGDSPRKPAPGGLSSPRSKASLPASANERSRRGGKAQACRVENSGLAERRGVCCGEGGPCSAGMRWIRLSESLARNSWDSGLAPARSPGEQGPLCPTSWAGMLPIYHQGGKESWGITTIPSVLDTDSQPCCLLSAVGQFPFFMWECLAVGSCFLFWFFFLIGNGDCKTIETDMERGVLGQFLHHLHF